ncbi:MAG TPA: type I-B CRISPR-associated protein Cas7/Cst2/DevR [Anaerolineales bacterium]|nr:type I-B CRISPR-associated protein Cas7/Cst2/DevR [Anaerolineales bacterium]
MSFVTGLLLIDAPASALNNLGNIPGARTDNTTGVKVIKAKDGTYPYVSAQAFRYWVRTTLEEIEGWKAAPIYREEKVAYTDANPILYWDDDLFGYMRAPSKKTSAKEKREADTSREDETPTTDTVTRVSPFRVSTLVSLAPVNITDDFGVMSRHEGDPVPHEHQFYRTSLKGLFSLDLHAVGTFSYRQKTGFRNLDETRVEIAKKQKGIEHLEAEKCYRLPYESRLQRITALFEGLARLEGGAKLTLHYTDVSPVLVVLAVTKGGNHIFGHMVSADSKGQPVFKIDALHEALTVFKEEILSNVYVGWVRGYLDDERAKLEKFAETETRVKISHPREAYKALIADLQKPENKSWLD